MNNKFYIDIEEDIELEDALRRVVHVVSQGKISENGKGEKYYCWLTTWNDGICVSVRNYRKSNCFKVWKRNTDIK